LRRNQADEVVGGSGVGVILQSREGLRDVAPMADLKRSFESFILGDWRPSGEVRSALDEHTVFATRIDVDEVHEIAIVLP